MTTNSNLEQIDDAGKIINTIPTQSPDTKTSTKCPWCELERLEKCDSGYIHDGENLRPCPNARKTERSKKVNRLLRESRIPDAALIRTFETFKGEQPIARTWAADPQGWLFLHGEVGTGKTHLAMAVLQEAIKKKARAGYFISAPDLVAQSKEIEQYIQAPMLVIDDVFAQRDTEYATELLFRVINHRYLSQFPTVITSNNSLKAMFDRGLDWSRISDRIKELCKGRIIKLQGASKR